MRRYSWATVLVVFSTVLNFEALARSTRVSYGTAVVGSGLLLIVAFMPLGLIALFVISLFRKNCSREERRRQLDRDLHPVSLIGLGITTFFLFAALSMCAQKLSRAQTTSPVPPRYDHHLQCQGSACVELGMRAIDGDSIQSSSGRTMRLYGIDAPELTQRCDGIEVGRQAQRHLQSLIQGGIACVTKGQDRYGRDLVICTNKDGVEINRQMVVDGLAFPYLRYSARYADVPKAGPIYAFKCSNPEDVRRKK